MINGYKIIYCVKKIAWFLKRHTFEHVRNKWELRSKDSKHWIYNLNLELDIINKKYISHTYELPIVSEFLTIEF